MAVRRVAPAVGLFVLAPLVGEYLLGNVSLGAPVYLLLLGPMYGGAAVVVREIARRAGLGWPGILLLALAYGLAEEGLATQTLFNRSYLGYDLLGPAYVPALGMGAWWTLFVLTLHTVWSISVPIALIEALVPDRRATPWLGHAGLLVAAVLFAVGAVVTAMGTYTETRFLASPAQLTGTVVAVAGCVVAAFAAGRLRPAAEDRAAPGPWPVGALTFGAGSLFLLLGHRPGWAAAGGYVVLYAVVTAAVLRWSRRTGWGAPHVLALAGGAVLAYAWHAFPQHPVLGPAGGADLIGNAVLAAGALALVAVGAAAVSRVPEDVPSRTPPAVDPR
ncbi:MAG TPA: hypothetical protein VGP02_15195 [Mycobacteriales bacterium]|nr:hypothetical protein [Mycobacteriales bacterium]